jgi:hypothetical protein
MLVNPANNDSTNDSSIKSSLSLIFNYDFKHFSASKSSSPIQFFRLSSVILTLEKSLSAFVEIPSIDK